MPGSGMDRITLSHGGGGRKTEELIKGLFQKYLKDPLILEMDDGARIDEFVLSTDSFVVNPLFFPGGDIGRLSVSGTVNDISVMGAKPLYLSLSFIIEEGFEIDKLERILQSIKDTAEEAGVRIVTGDTKVVEKGKADGIYINTTGLGKMVFYPSPSIERVEPGDIIIINGSIGLHGISVMMARGEFGLESDVKSDVSPLWGLISGLREFNVKFMRDPTRGGLAQVLNEMVSNKNFGIEIWEESIPVSEEVNGVCEILGFDPLYMANEGKVVLVVDKDDGERVIERMKNSPYAEKPSVIGRITEEHRGVVTLKTDFGTERIVMPATGEILPRIC